MTDDLDQLAINAIRTLSMDAVQKADSGHPGTPMALAPLGYTLFTRYLAHNPADPSWPDRDRFVLSAGHASMLLYSLLHLTGYDLPMGELERFRQLGSRTPGHPESFETTGVETTTGPLGQGVGNAVGMALAERLLAARFNRPGHDIVDHRTWVLASDGDLMEGVTAEASSLAGHLGLERLVIFYDDNGITIDGSTELSFDTEDVAARYAAYGWRTLDVEDPNDLELIDKVTAEAAEPDGRPTLIRVRSIIGYPAPNAQNTAKAHGSPLGADEVAAARGVMRWTLPPFTLPDGLAEHVDQRRRGADLQHEWDERFAAYRDAHPDLADEFERVLAGRLPADWDATLAGVQTGAAQPTRKSSGAVINAVAGVLPELVGGSADLAGSNKTTVKGSSDIARADYRGRNVNYGLREHAMGAVCNGLALHGGVRPFAGTFLVFSDYLRPALRLACLMGLPVIYVMTHDSIGLGEDGPTHQPVEHLASLRAMPNLHVVRPADAAETVGAWRAALTRTDGPTLLALTRQQVPALAGTDAARVSRGAYVVAGADAHAVDVVIVATGSEVQHAVAAVDLLARRDVRARAVSMPSWELFAAADADYRESVLPRGVPVLSVEAATSFGWSRWADAHVALDRFGASAPEGELFTHFGFTPDAVAEAAAALVAHP